MTIAGSLLEGQTHGQESCAGYSQSTPAPGSPGAWVDAESGLRAQHDYSQGRLVLQEAVEIARQIKHAEFLSLALCFLGKALGYVDAYDCAVGYFQESLSLAQQLSAPLLLIILLTTWGELQLFHGQFDAAREHFQDVLALDAEEQRYPEMLALAYFGMAHIALHEQNIEKAREHAAESMRLFKQIGHYKAQEVQAWIEALPEGRLMPPERHQAVQEGTV